MNRHTQMLPDLNGSLQRVDGGENPGTTANSGPSHGISRLQDCAAAPRATLESIAARPLTEADWERSRSRLLEFVAILRDWDRKAEASRHSELITLYKARDHRQLLEKAA